MDVLRLLVFTEAWEGLLPAQSSHDEPAGVLRPESLHSASQVGLEHAVPSYRQTNQNRSQWHLCRISLPHMSLVQARCFLQVRRGGSLVTTWARDAGLHRSWQHCVTQLFASLSRAALLCNRCQLSPCHGTRLISWPLLLVHADPPLPA